MKNLNDEISSLFDYRGDVARNKNASSVTYHVDYSPNNIKTVIISPNGVLVIFHHSVNGLSCGKGTGKIRYTEFATEKLMNVEAEKGYKPILNYLSSPVCSSLEEVVILTESIGVQNPYFMQMETQLGGLVKSYNGAGEDVTERVKNRFGRLRYFTLMACNFQQLLKYMIANAQYVMQQDFISDIPALQGQCRSKAEVNSEDTYWRNYGNQATYQFDRVTLAPYFKRIIEKNEEELKKAKVAQFKSDREKSSAKALNDEVALYNKMFELNAKFMNIVRKCGSNGVVSFDGITPYTFKPLISYNGICNVNKHLLNNVEDPKAMEKDKEIVRDIKSKMVDYYSEVLISRLKSLADMNNPISLSVLLHGAETSVIVPPSCSSDMSEITRITQFIFDGRNTSTSIANAIWLFCLFFVDRTSDAYKTDYIKREFWEGAVK